MNGSEGTSRTFSVRHPPSIIAALLLVGALAAACSAPPPPPPTPPDGPAVLRVMTWNVQTGQHDPAEWAEVVARLRPDVVGLQEICSDEVGELAGILRRDHGLDYTAVPGPVRPGPGEAGAEINAALGPACDTAPDAVEFGLGVLSRLPVTASAGSAVTLFPPDRRDEQRGYLTVRVSPAGGPPVAVVTTHVGLDGVAGEQIRRLAETSTATADPTVVLGDLNVGVDAAELAPLRRSFAEVDPAGRYATSALRKIDYVFARGLRPVGEPEAPEVTASDHRPLLGVLAVGAR